MARLHRAWGSHALLIACACVLALTCPVRADDRFDAQRLHVAPNRATGYVGVLSPRTAGKRATSTSLWLDAFSDPLVLSKPPTADMPEGVKRWGSIVDRRVDLHFLFAYGLTDWLELGLDVPLVLSQTGDQIPGADFPADRAGVGLGDVRLVPRAELVSQRDDGTGFGLGLALDAALPTGSQRDFRSDGLRMTPTLSAEYAWRPFRAAVNVGYIARPQSHLGSLEHDDAATLGVAAEAFLTRSLSVVGEFDWERGIAASAGSTAHRGRDLLLHGRYLLLERLLFEVGGGRGLVPNSTVPEWRVFGGLGWVGRGRQRTHDADGDGVPDERDRCATAPEDRDGVEDGDGCPDLDQDRDGVADAQDGCPNQAEDADGTNDGDGCPDPDNDGDGVLDTRDVCPNQAEDMDGLADADGCPDPDDDGDGVPDVSDGCPREVEDQDGVADEDGCPEPDPVPAPEAAPASQPVRAACTPEPFPEHVQFVQGRTTLTHAGRVAMRGLARQLKASPDVTKVRIEGHADDLGNDLFNQSLSQRRALFLASALKRRGVTQQIESVGFGESRPLADTTDEGRARNRRAEVVVTGRAGCE